MSKTTKFIASIVGLIALGFGALGLAQDGTLSKTITIKKAARYYVEAVGAARIALRDSSGEVISTPSPNLIAWLAPGEYTLEITPQGAINPDTAVSFEERNRPARLEELDR